jgi:hypothetical protein
MKLKTLIFAAAVALPFSAHAYQLDRTMSCDMTVRGFFAPLVQQNAIQIPAERVAPTGANYFKKSANDSLSFFNMTVGYVVGYTDDPLLFKPPADGHVPDFQGYGFLVQSPIAEVQATLASVGYTKPQVRRIQPDVTYIYCEYPAAQ